MRTISQIMWQLTAAMEGLLESPAGGCVTSAPRNMTGSRNTAGLQAENKYQLRTDQMGKVCQIFKWACEDGDSAKNTGWSWQMGLPAKTNQNEWKT